MVRRQIIQASKTPLHAFHRSDWDLNVCLAYECKRKLINRPTFFDGWVDIRALYAKFYARKPQGLNGALQDLGIAFEGRQHSGLDDARNTAKLVARVIADGGTIVLTKWTVNTKSVDARLKNMPVVTAADLALRANAAVSYGEEDKAPIEQMDKLLL